MAGHATLDSMGLPLLLPPFPGEAASTSQEAPQRP